MKVFASFQCHLPFLAMPGPSAVPTLLLGVYTPLGGWASFDVSGRSVKMVDIFWKWQNYGTENKSAVARHWGWEKGCFTESNEGIWGFVCDGAALYLDCGGSYMTVCVCLSL